MRIKFNENNDVTGYGCFGNPEYPEYSWENPPERLIDDYGNFLYSWDVENKTVIAKTVVLSAEQKTVKRSRDIKGENPYSADEEFALINKAILNGVTDEEYVAYRATIEALKIKYPKG